MTEREQLAVESQRFEELLEEVRGLVALPVFQRVEAAIAMVVRLYGAGLASVLDHARSAGADRATLDDELTNDDLVASLLVLHGLHPLSVEQRIQRALALVRAELAIDDEALTLVAIGDGSVQLAARDGLTQGAMSPGLAERVIRRAIETAAPEVDSIAFTGLAPRLDPSLVQLRTTRP